jgi:hypothetical protein
MSKNILYGMYCIAESSKDFSKGSSSTVIVLGGVACIGSS